MLRVGTSGWQYRDWRGVLYPRGLATPHWLRHYATAFDTVEINSSFYRLPDRDLFARWAASVPAGFVFAVKVSRYLTHVRRLRDPAEPVARFLRSAEGLGGKLGPVLLQLPPDLVVSTGDLAATLDAFGGRVRVAVEPRHPSWFADDVYALLARHDAALCWADRRSRPVVPVVRTASWCYLRLHEGTAGTAGGYGRRALTTWVGRILVALGPHADGFVYCNNDAAGCAVRNARQLRGAAQRRGLDTSVPV
jgi:uncharacterized protein YecE (DUF72 family)